MRMKLKISRILCLLVMLAGISLYTKAQGVILDADTVIVESPDSTVQAVLQSADSASQVKVKAVDMKPFKPNPTKAVIFSAILPGLGILETAYCLRRFYGMYLCDNLEQ